MLKLLATWLLVPVALIQGIKVRRTTPRLTPPEGPISGIATPDGKAVPDAPDRHLLIIGDSSVAGLGAPNIDQALTLPLAQALAKADNAPVYWRAVGSNSATAGAIRDVVVPNIERKNYTDILLVIGTNDAKNFHTVNRFKREFGELLYGLKARFPDARIVWSPAVNMQRMPSLPPLLGWILETRAKAINAKAKQLCLERYVIPAERLFIAEGQDEGFAHDGFHASPMGYEAWVALVTPYFLREEIDRKLEGKS